MPSVGHKEYGVSFELTHDPLRITEVDEGHNDTLDDKYKQLAKEIFGETDEKRRELLPRLRDELIKKGFKVPDKEAYYVKMLRAGGFTVHGAIEVMTNYIANLMESPHYLANAKATNAAHLCSMNVQTILPQRDRYGRRVYIFRPGVWNPDSHTYADVFAIGYMLSELMALEPKTQIAGVVLITDAAGFGFKQFWNFSMEDAKKTASFIQDSFPLWFRTTHIVNAPGFFHLAYNLVRPMLKPSVRDSLIFHTNLDSLHACIDKEILPKEFGGEGGEFSNAECVKALEQMGGLIDELKAVKREK